MIFSCSTRQSLWKVGLAGLLGLLSGCGTGTEYGDLFKAVGIATRNGFGPGRITRAEAAAVPYASLGYRVNNGRELMLVLATVSGKDLLWTSSSHVLISTRDGRIRRTLGLPRDLAAMTSLSGEETPRPAVAFSGPFNSRRSADWPDIGAYSVPISCRAMNIGRQQIIILGSVIKTVRINETCNAPTVKWSFTDSYWIDPDNLQTWRTIQHIHPNGGVIEINILRPPE